MKSKQEILNKAITGSYSNSDWIVEDLGYSDCYKALDEYAQTLAKEVIEELENEWNGYESLPADYVITLIKAKFNLT